MIALLIGSAAVWGLATAVFGGNWQAGLVVAGVVFFLVLGGMRNRRAELEREERAQAAQAVMDALYAPEPRRRWFR